MKPTEKQIAYVERIVAKLGREYVQNYIGVEIEKLTKNQAQKIITGLGNRISKPIYGVVGRDVPFSRWH